MRRLADPPVGRGHPPARRPRRVPALLGAEPVEQDDMHMAVAGDVAVLVADLAFGREVAWVRRHVTQTSQAKCRRQGIGGSVGVADRSAQASTRAPKFLEGASSK